MITITLDDLKTKMEKYMNTWQLCPKCLGDGNLLRYNSPTFIGGTSETSVCPTCDVCKGKKIISRETGFPPIFESITNSNET